MSLPPPSGPQRPDKPLAARPGPLPMSPPPKPFPPATPPLRTRKRGGPSVLAIVLCVVGALGLMMLLVCGGTGWWVYSKVQLAKRRVQEAQLQVRPQQGPYVPTSRSFPPRPDRQQVTSIPQALAALDDGNHFRREEAANYLAAQPVDANQRAAVVRKALPLLDDGSRRDQGRRILAKWITADDAAKLVPHLNHPDGGARQMVRELLAQFQVAESLLARQCVADLDSAERERKREAARWLTQHVIFDETLSPLVSDALVRQLSNRDVRSDAAAALALWATSDGVPKLVAAAHAAHLASDREAQHELVQLLAKMKDKRGLPALAEYFESNHNRFAAKSAFSTFGPEAADTVLPFVNHSDHSVQHFARQLLAEWKVAPDAFVGQHVKDLASGDPQRQRGVLNWLARQEVDAAQQAAVAKGLEPLLNNPDLRRDALRAMKVWATSDNVPALIVLLDEQDASIRSEALQILTALKDPRAVPHIGAGFAGDFFKRSEAARSLRAMGPVAETAVWPHTTNADWQVAIEACNVLKDIGTRRSLPALQLATQHASPLVQNAAKQAIAEVEAAKRTLDPMQVAASETTAAPKRGMREWKDASGKNTIHAEFVEFASGRVKLKTREGRMLSLNVSQLSPEDRQYVIELMQQP